MSHIELPFIFDAESCDLIAEGFSLRLPEGIRGKDSLLSHYAKAGHFPDYFGNNWDALNDCLRDFSWIPAKHIIIVHDDLPLLGDDNELLTYLEILRDAVINWSVSERHRLVAVFPSSSEPAMTRLIGHR